MDILQDYTPTLLTLYQTALPFLQPILLPLYTTASTIRRTLPPLLLPYCNQALTFAHQQPAIVSVLLFLLLLYIALRILGFIRRIIAFWVSVVMKLIFWGAVGLVISLVYQRGLERTVGDLMGWGQVIGEVWWREYERWEGLQKGAQTAGGNGGGRYGRDYLGVSRGNTGWR